MALEFKNANVATALIFRNDGQFDGKYVKLQGVNGKQTSADNFNTAIRALYEIGAVAIETGDDMLVRNVDQNVRTTT